MRIPGQRIRRTRLIQSDRYVVAVDVEMVVPVDDPSEPCYEAETINLLREIKERADAGDLRGCGVTAKCTKPSGRPDGSVSEFAEPSIATERRIGSVLMSSRFGRRRLNRVVRRAEPSRVPSPSHTDRRHPAPA